MDIQKKKTTFIFNWKFIFLAFISITIILFLMKQKDPITHSTQCYSHKNHSTLIFTQILFRHGERAPLDNSGPYPNDPYKNYSYEPYGPGALVDAGKRTLYQVGKYIRTYYCHLLQNYHRDIVYAISSPSPRSRVSLLIVLAAMFPPEKQLFPTNDLNWQPIAYDYEVLNKDTAFVYFVTCKRYVHLYNIETEKSIANNEVKGFKELAGKLEVLTGMKYNSYRKLFTLYSYLQTQKEFGLRLPHWTREYMPLLEKYQKYDYNISTRSEELKTLSGGFILSKMIKSIQSKISDPKMENRKIHLYSGHDFTIANLMGTLNIKLANDRSTTIPYGSYIALELHQIKNIFAVKLLYHEGTDEYTEIITLDGCPELCPLETFLRIYSKYMASPDMCNL